MSTQPEKDNVPPSGFRALFNGKDFTGWKVPEGDNGHWKIIDGIIDYDAESEAKCDKNLWHFFGATTGLIAAMRIVMICVGRASTDPTC